MVGSSSGLALSCHRKTGAKDICHTHAWKEGCAECQCMEGGLGVEVKEKKSFEKLSNQSK